MPALAHPGVLEDNPMTVGAFLKQQRTRLGLSQKEAAEAADILLPTYKYYEQDKGYPPLDKAVRLSEVLKFDPRDLFQELANPGSVVEPPKAKPGRGRPKLVKPDPEPAEDDLAEDDQVEDDQAEDDQAETLPTEKRPHVIALAKVANLARRRGVKSRHLPGAVEAAEQALGHLDADELHEVVEAMGFGFLPCPAVEELDGLDADELDKHCEGMVPRLIATALYGDALEQMDAKALEGIANTISDTVYRDKRRSFGLVKSRFEVVESKRWGEKPEEYLLRLRRELAPHLLEAVKRRKPVVIQAGEEEDTEEN